MEHSETLTAFLNGLPADRRDSVSAALSQAFDHETVTRVAPIPGGASGASLFSVDLDTTNESTYLLRVEGPKSPFRNPHQYACMQIAAEAGLAPPLRYVDAEAGIALMQRIPSRPLSDFPGGAPAVARALGALVRRLQDTDLFPEFRDYATVLERLLTMMRGKCAPGLLDRHAAGLEELTTAYPWNASPRVSSHNDLNPYNVLFDGQRLWIIDWETAYRNDPFVDLAIAAEHRAATPELEHLLLDSWSDAAVDRTSEARLRVMRVLTRLYYAGLLLMIGTAASREPIVDLSALTESEFLEQLAAGTLAPRSPDTMTALGKMQLAKFIDGLNEPTTLAAVRTLRGGE